MSDCPFCGHEWKALTDLNQTIILEKKLAKAKTDIEALRSFVAKMEPIHRGHQPHSLHSLIQEANAILARTKR